MIRLLAPPPAAASGRRVVLITVGLFAVLGVLAGVTPVAPAVPVGLILGTIGVALALGSPWHGTIAVLMATIFLPTPFSVHLGGATLSVGRLLLFALAAGWLAALKRTDRPVLPRRTPLDAPMAFLLAALLAATILNLPTFSSLELSGAIRKVATFGIDFFLLFWIVVSVLSSPARIERLLRILTAAVGVTALLGLVEHATHKNVFEYLSPVLPGGFGRFIHALAQSAVLTRGRISRVHSTFEHPLAFAFVLVMVLPLALAFTLVARDRLHRMCWAVVAAVMGAALLFTASRAAYLLTGLAAVTMISLLPDRRARAGVFTAALALTGLFLLQPSVRDTMIAFFHPHHGTKVEGSLQARIDDYRPVFHVVGSHPLLGTGPRTFAFDELRHNGLLKTPLNLVLDNSYLTHVAETGVVGLLVLLLFHVMAYATAWRAFRRSRTTEVQTIRLALFTAVQSWVIMGLFADVYIFNAPPKVFFVLLAAVAVSRIESGWPDDRPAVRERANVGV